LVRLPPEPDGVKVGLDDFLCSHTPNEFRALLKKADGEPDGGKDKQKSTAKRLVELAVESGAEWFHDENKNGFAAIPVDEHIETHSLRSEGFKSWLKHLLYKAEGRPAPATALQDAIGVLDAMARFDGRKLTVWVRVAFHNGKVFLDLADEQWRAVQIDASGWRVVDNPPVRFRRSYGMLPLPEPVGGGSLDDLRDFINILNGGDWRLLIAWMVASIYPYLHPRAAFPILCLLGQQGSAKTTAGKLLRALIDPNTAPLRTPPKEARDLMIAAINGWVLAYDNLSYLPEWLSNILCCLTNKGGFSTRQLYSDGDEVIFAAARPVVLTSIVDAAVNADILDRAVRLDLPPIPEGERMTERELWGRFDEQHPRILGALLSVLSGTMKQHPDVSVAEKSRMADFIEVGVAVERACGWKRGAFLTAYEANRASAHEVVLEGSPLVSPLKALMKMRADEWTGTATDLLQELGTIAGDDEKKKKAWPKDAGALGGKLKRLAPSLRAIGIVVEQGQREGKRGTRTIRITKRKSETTPPMSKVGKTPSAPSAPSATSKNAGKSSDFEADGLADGLPQADGLAAGKADGADGRQTANVSKPSARKPLENKEKTKKSGEADGADGILPNSTTGGVGEPGTPRRIPTRVEWLATLSEADREFALPQEAGTLYETEVG
jgi:hypothetical protein